MLWGNRIRDAIDNDRLQLYAQPIISLNKKSSNEKYVEVLIRLLDKDNQLIQPNDFIPAAERYDLMHLIDKKVILETFLFISENLAESNITSHFSINLSINTLCDKSLTKYIKQLVRKIQNRSRQLFASKFLKRQR